jgi:antibiotic biosynthesis monooxygenase (ABM) superfamily enzyme
MLFRLLKMQVRPDRLAEWLAFTRDVGFPGMLRQPGCRAIWRLRGSGGETDFHVMTQWDSTADLARFNASAARRDLTEAAAGLTIPPTVETLFEVVDDPPP